MVGDTSMACTMLGLPTVRLRTGSGNCTMVDLPTGTLTSLCARMAPTQLGPLMAVSRLAAAVAGLPIVTWMGPDADILSGLAGAVPLSMMALSTPACAWAMPVLLSPHAASSAAATAVAFTQGPMRRAPPRCWLKRSMSVPQLGCSA
ncbi:hypothetical protein R77591_02711 [Ralstonia mannitolilytica]|uniref:Uncharacterized protein n=1 Tax=Ralstonia mannitolilytica TaxID=105219 RepID=A0AAD2EIJ8_9RALS|nr:hypothetical protein R77591_02711 [Ralstonia mannitolilytica]CAJ0896887.1 hypothetical protein R77569_04643 [Ralstonia mannitolilytica]